MTTHDYETAPSTGETEPRMPEDHRAANGETIKVPKWVLVFVLPALAFGGMILRTEQLTSENRARIEAWENRYEKHLEDARGQKREVDLKNIEQDRTIQYLCQARKTDDRESGRATIPGPC